MKYRLTLILSAVLFLVPKMGEAGDQAALIERGRVTFQMQCARCHGMEGKGDGVDAKKLTVAPRDLVDDEYKFKSTEYGTPPSDEDLRWVLNHGMAGAEMPSFANLTEDTKTELIAYIKSISKSWGEYEPIPIAAPNVRLKPNLVRGQEVFEALQCALCHGNGGRANGTSAQVLQVPPANLTEPWNYRAGSSPEQIYYRLNAGIAGSGMPSYTESGYTTNDLWHLANYVKSLQLQPNWNPLIVGAQANKALPSTAEDSAWDQAKQTEVILKSNRYQGKNRLNTTVDVVSVQTMYTDSEIAFRLSWNDPTGPEDRRPDAILMAFKPDSQTGDARDNLINMYRPNSKSILVMKWSSREPTLVYTGQATLKNASRANWKSRQTLNASATYEDGLWTLVFSRPKLTDQDPALSEDGFPQFLGMTAWDGGNNEQLLDHSASQWIAFAATEPALHH